MRRDAHAAGLFVVETWTQGRWTARSTKRSIQAATDYAWELIAREGGQARVRNGADVVAEGATTAERVARP